MLKDSIERTKKERSLTAPGILLYLAQNKSRSKWQIANDLHKSYGNVHASVHDMLDYRVIKIEDTKPGARNKKIDVEYYSLTFDGLMLALALQESLDVIDKIAETQKGILPLIFGKWRFFEQNGVKPLIVERLQEVARDERSMFFALTRPEEKYNPIAVEGIFRNKKLQLEKISGTINEVAAVINQVRIAKNVLFFSLFSSNPLLTGEAKDQWELLSVLKKDKELKTFVKEQYEQIRDQYKSHLTNIENRLKAW